MRFLDIDLDFFLSDIPTFSGAHDERLPDGLVDVWDDERVRAFFEESLGLSGSNRVEAMFVERHDGVLDIMLGRLRPNSYQEDNSIVHVDSHADLGFGTNTVSRLIGMSCHALDWRRSIPLEVYRNYDEETRGELDETNYLLYAIFLELISSIDYVHNEKLNPNGRDADICKSVIAGIDAHESGRIWLRIPKLKDGILVNDLSHELFPYWAEDSNRNATVPLRFVSPLECSYSEGFDLAFLAHSQSYTPQASDRLIPVVCDYLDFGRAEDKMRKRYSR